MVFTWRSAPLWTAPIRLLGHGLPGVNTCDYVLRDGARSAAAWRSPRCRRSNRKPCSGRVLGSNEPASLVATTRLISADREAKLGRSLRDAGTCRVAISRRCA